MSLQLHCRDVCQVSLWSVEYIILNQSTWNFGLISNSIEMSLVERAPGNMTRWQRHPHGPLARYLKLRVVHVPGMPGTFSPPPRVSDLGMHHGTCVTHVPGCMPGSLTGGFLWSRWRGKRSRHSRRMRSPQCNVSGNRPISHLWYFRRHLSSDHICAHRFAEGCHCGTFAPHLPLPHTQLFHGDRVPRHLH